MHDFTTETLIDHRGCNLLLHWWEISEDLFTYILGVILLCDIKEVIKYVYVDKMLKEM